MTKPSPVSIARAAEAIATADAILVTAGAGMGVDSGLPDFRGNEGFWRAYPPFRAAGLSFAQVATPHWFDDDPARAWGFYGHRRNLYRATTPHAGFTILKRWCDQAPNGGAVFTSNVDGHFQRAGFAPEQITECHGTIELNQCVRGCCERVWPAENAEVTVDPATFRAAEPFPRCPECGRTARPNVLMFGDFAWVDGPTSAQTERLGAWLAELAGKRLAIVEIGAGTAVPTVRAFSERVAKALSATLIRINPRDSDGPSGAVSIAVGALESLIAIDSLRSG